MSEFKFGSVTDMVAAYRIGIDRQVGNYAFLNAYTDLGSELIHYNKFLVAGAERIIRTQRSDTYRVFGGAFLHEIFHAEDIQALIFNERMVGEGWDGEFYAIVVADAVMVGDQQLEGGRIHHIMRDKQGVVTVGTIPEDAELWMGLLQMNKEYIREYGARFAL